MPGLTRLIALPIAAIARYIAPVLTASLITLGFAGKMSAQEIKPLEEVAKNSAKAYPLSRCSALYLALMEWSGEERMSAESWSKFDAARENMIVLSAYISQHESGGTFDHWLEMTIRDVRNIADLYLARLEKNYAAVGQAFGEDSLIQSDLTLCTEIAKSIQ